MTTHYQHIKLDHLAPSPTNPRKHFDADGLQELAGTITDHGVIEPIIVRLWPDDYDTPEDRTERPLYEIVAGERRYRASMLAGLDDIPALVRILDTRQVLEIQVIENLQRRGVDELEEADGYQIMMRDYGYTADDLAAKVSKSKAYIYARLKLASLCKAGREAFYKGTLTASVALLVARIPGAQLQTEALAKVLNDWRGPLSAREAATIIQRDYMLHLKDAPFPVENAFLIVVAGACTKCPKNTTNAQELFPDAPADVCTDPACYANKRANHLAREVETLTAAGYTLITGKAAEKLAPHGIYSATVGNYVQLDEKADYGDSYTTARKALGKAAIETLYIEDTRRGRLVEVVEKKTLATALAAAGVKHAEPDHVRENREKEAKAKAEGEYRRALFEATRAEYAREFANGQNPYLFADDMRLVARQFLARQWDETRKKLARRYVEPDAKIDPVERFQRLLEMIDTMTAGDLCTLLLDTALAGMTDTPSSWASDISTPKPLLITAHAYGVDPDALRRKLKAESKQPPKEKKQPPTPEQAAPAHDLTAEKPEGQKPETKAAPARASKATKPEKPKVNAASAARKATIKTKESGRASPAGGKGKTVAPPADKAEDPPPRCDKTIDIFEGATA